MLWIYTGGCDNSGIFCCNAFQLAAGARVDIFFGCLAMVLPAQSVALDGSDTAFYQQSFFGGDAFGGALLGNGYVRIYL